MRHVRPLLIALLALAVLGWQGHDARATHDGTGEHIDQISIDVGPSGVANGVEGDGKPAAGDRDGDTVLDAEGYAPFMGGAPGVCDNGLDDDQADTDGDTVPGPGGFDGVADDGCVVTLTERETCAEIIDDDVLNADEDQLVTGQDRASIDITVGNQPGPGGGIPASRPFHAFQFTIEWDRDVLDVDVASLNFLILANGGGSPFTAVLPALPVLTSPFVAAVADAGPKDSGPGVLARLRIEGNAAGIANIAFVPAGMDMKDQVSQPIPIDALNGVKVAVSKDGPDNGTIIGDSPGELFRCPIDQISIDMGPPGVANGVDGNGKPAVGDRDGDGLVDAEGARDQSSGGSPVGVCGNGVDDDPGDTTGDTIPDSDGFDGVADDGCQVTLTPLEACAEIIDDGILNADEDSLVSGQDRMTLDITTGAQPGPGGGIPAGRPISAWQVSFNWNVDLLDVDIVDLNFLILSNGGAQPFTRVVPPLPVTASPMTFAVSDAGPADSGAAVLSRLTVEGNSAGIAKLTLGGWFSESLGAGFPAPDTINSARVAVSKDGPDADTTIGDTLGEVFHCPGSANPDDDGDGVYDTDEQGCGSDPLSTARRPERLDGAFAGMDDDGDTEVDEPLPPGSASFDCDGDGWAGERERHIFSARTTANDQDSCGNNGWPADVSPSNQMNISDFNRFVHPLRGDGSFNKFGHSIPDPDDPNLVRFDLQPDGVINIADMNAQSPGVLAPTSHPPMFGGQPAFFTNGGLCPWPP